MLANLRMTIQESLRYRGRSGHYSWLAHRISGLGILGFLVIHVWDTANAHFAPNTYQWTIDVFKHPLFGFGEIMIFGAVIYHAFNGIRITLLDFKPEWWQYQGRSALIVWALFLIIFIPAAVWLLYGIVESCGHAPIWNGVEYPDATCWNLPPYADYR